jgi:23S rRNA-intervening sequence protein
MKESPVFVKMFDFVAWLIPLTLKFPREQRFVVARALQRETLAAHEDLIRAGYGETPDATLLSLHAVATHLALIRFHLRLCERWSLITVKQYEYAVERLAEIGRLTRAWQVSCASKRAATTVHEA